MEIGVISDIHNNHVALKKVLEEVRQAGIKRLICAGDVVGYGASPNRCVEELKGWDMEAVLGNHDHAVVRDKDLDWFNQQARKGIKYTQKKLKTDNKRFMESLPQKITLELGESEASVAHGSPIDPLFEYVREKGLESRKELFKDSDIWVMGHTHVPYAEKVNGTLVVNPGSVGQPRDKDPRASYGILNTAEMDFEVRRVEYNIDKAAERIKEEGLPSNSAKRLYKGV